MFRTAQRRRSESARNYVDFSVEDPSLDTLLSLAATTLGFATAMVNIIDEDRQYTVAQHGDRGPTVMPRDDATCALVVDAGRPVAISDSRREARSTDPLAAAAAANLVRLEYRSYVAVPLVGREGLVIGTLCVVDTEPHPAGDYVLSTLSDFARLVESHLDAIRGHGRSTWAPRGPGAVLGEGEIVPWFQPIVDLDSGDVVAFEALARLLRPTGTGVDVVPPEDFFSAVADTDLEIDVDHTVLAGALAAFAGWLTDVPTLDLHVNLCARHLGVARAVEQLDEIVTASAVPPQRVVFELTETRSYTDSPRAVAFVRDLRLRGYRVVLDDLGTGHSSLERLVELPVDGFKVDKALSHRMGSPDGDTLVGALTGFASVTERSVVVEGIETEEQARSARHNGCTLVQGFLYSRAVPAADVRALGLV